MRAEDIPEELRQMLDDDAGKVHSVNGRVMTTLARILTRHRELILEELKLDL